MIIIGLIEDSKFEYQKWQFLAESSEIPCEIRWFEKPEDFLSSAESFDLLILDRSFEIGDRTVDIVTSGYLRKIRDRFDGPLVYASDAPLFKDEREFFAKALPGKSIKSIPKLLKSLGIVPESVD